VTAIFELPGLRKEDVNIEVLRDRLTISGESSTSKETNEPAPTLGFENVQAIDATHSTSTQGRCAIRERQWGTFIRTLELPWGVKAEEVKAVMEDGLLTLTFPKSKQEAPHRIAIA